MGMGLIWDNEACSHQYDTGSMGVQWDLLNKNWVATEAQWVMVCLEHPGKSDASSSCSPFSDKPVSY